MRPSNTSLLIYALILVTVFARIGKEIWETWGH